MANIVPHGGVDSDKTANQRKQIERQLEEDEGAEYYVYDYCGNYLTNRTLKLHSHIMLHQEVAEFLQGRTICTFKLTSTLESKDSLAFRYVYSLGILSYFQLSGLSSRALLEPFDFACK